MLVLQDNSLFCVLFIPKSRGAFVMTSVNTLKFPEEISIANVTEWKPRFVEFVEAPSPLILDCEDLVRVDTAAIQLMTAFVIKAISQGKTVEWEKPSPTLLQTVRLLGLNDTLLIKE